MAPALRDQNRTPDGRYAPDSSGRAGIPAPGAAPVGYLGHPGHPAGTGRPAPGTPAAAGVQGAELLDLLEASARRSRIGQLLEIAERVEAGGAFHVDPATGVTLPSHARVPDVVLDLTPGEPVTAEADADAEAQLAARGWAVWSHGRSNQHGYTGPWLHPSEVMSDAIAADMLEQGGVFAVVYPTDAAGEHIGWGILRKTDA